jgi:hypothetical protein
MPRPESQYLRTLYAPLLSDAMAEIEVALKVAVGLEAGMKPEAIAARLDVSLGEVRDAKKRLAQVRKRLELGE